MNSVNSGTCRIRQHDHDSWSAHTPRWMLEKQRAQAKAR